MPEWRQARLDAGETNDLPHTEYRADAVVTLSDHDRPVLSVVVEIQLRRDPAKRWSWPVYLATLRARHRCPVLLLVVCPDSGTASWCGEPIELGHPGWMLRPLVAGPNQIPAVVDTDGRAGTAELAVLSVLAHAGGPAGQRALDAANVALDAIDPGLAIRYIEIMFAALPEAARRYLEALMSTETFEFQSDYARRLRAEGEAEGELKGELKGEAKVLLVLLDARGWKISGEVRGRISSCSDPEQLERWARKAAIASSLAEVFN